MLTKTDGKNAKAGKAIELVALATAENQGNTGVSRLTSEQVWDEVAKASFAVLSYVTPSGEPRSSGVVYKTVGRRWYAAVAPEGWKARHVAASGRVSVTVPVHRGGVLSLVVPIPPATVSFHGSAIVHPAGSPDARTFIHELAPLLPAERQASAAIIEVVPEGVFVTYGVGMPLMKMRDPGAASARVPVASR
jgi:Pyridoxamine 5'-phosphate oxidase